MYSLEHIILPVTMYINILWLEYPAEYMKEYKLLLNAASTCVLLLMLL